MILMRVVHHSGPHSKVVGYEKFDNSAWFHLDSLQTSQWQRGTYPGDNTTRDLAAGIAVPYNGDTFGNIFENDIIESRDTRGKLGPCVVKFEDGMFRVGSESLVNFVTGISATHLKIVGRKDPE